MQADFDNFRRRNEGVRADAFAEGQRKVATAMLPVLDNLERALAAAENADADALKTGVEMTRKQMVAAYEKLGVTPIDRLGEKFDPDLEEAIMQGTADDGRTRHGVHGVPEGLSSWTRRVLRHAMVKVVARLSPFPSCSNPMRIRPKLSTYSRQDIGGHMIMSKIIGIDLGTTN